LPVAVVPLWQLKQRAVTSLWSKRVADQLRVLWQLPQSAEVGTWLGPLPVAVVPLWQRTQPWVIPLWSKRAGSQLDVMWQSSQALELGTWSLGLKLASHGPLGAWQILQLLGVPSNTPPTWQDSHEIRSCIPVSTKPVRMCSKSSGTAADPRAVAPTDAQ
jgi:hypothetical protein